MSLKEDIATLQSIVLELRTLKDGATLLKSSLEQAQNARVVIGATKRVKLIKDDFTHLCNTLLSQNDPGVFVVNKQLQFHPAVPEFIHNAAETKIFIDCLGSINQRVDFPEVPSNSLGGLPGLASLEPRLVSHRSQASV